jgi:quinoprotein glucose dehydrogenase
MMKRYRFRLFLLLLAIGIWGTGCQPDQDDHRGNTYLSHPSEWRSYQGGPDRNQYSPLRELTPANVAQLTLAWTYESEALPPDAKTQIQCNPLVVDGILYGSSPRLKIFALDATTGEQIWQFDPFGGPEKMGSLGANRGLSYWQKGEDRRILFSAGSWLYALDARTGKPIKAFGEKGRTSLKAGLGKRAQDLFVISNAPGAIYQDLLIMGSRVSEFTDAAPGYIQAFHIPTGQLSWVFHTIPKPGEKGHDTWPEDAHTYIGGANAWAGMSVDHARGLVFIPTGSAAFDFYGGNRPGANLFANCVLALKAATGEYVWHFQTTHHDIWDRDLPTPPNLVTIMQAGKPREVVAQATKQGFVFVLDRETGEPVFPVEEQPFPASDLEGEETWPTQPVPVVPPPFARQAFTEAEVTNRSPEAHADVLARLKTYRTGQNFTPGSLEGTVILPGFDGGAEWGGQAFDPETGRYYVNANEMAWVLTMVPVEPPDASQALAAAGQQLYVTNCASCHGQQLEGGGGGMGTYPALTDLSERVPVDTFLHLLRLGKGVMPSYQHLEESEVEKLVAFFYEKSSGIDYSTEAFAKEATAESETEKPYLPYAHTGYHKFLDPEGYPALRPPWGTLTAIDLNEGKIDWQVPLGEFEELTAQGMPKTGAENYGGPVVTAGGLIFIAATKDEHIRAFDKATGEELWKYKLPAGGYATPATYAIDGKQFVVIACGGGKMGTASGAKYLAFALGE